jgi:hypothetical protein
MNRIDEIRDLATLVGKGSDRTDPSLAAALDLIADELASMRGASETHPLLIQLRCGTTDPREDADHPGHMLIALGWTYYGPDDYGCEWSAPNGDERMSLPQALAAALREALINTGEPDATQPVIS